MNIRKMLVLVLLLLALAGSMFPGATSAQATAYASVAMYVRCASGALPAIGYYQSTWQRNDGVQYFHDLHYDGVIGGYRAYSYVQAVPGNYSYRNKVDSSGGYTTGWSGYKFVSPGYSIGWTYYRTVSC